MTTALPQNVKDALNDMIQFGFDGLDEELAIVRTYYLERTPDELFNDAWALIEEHDEPFACPSFDQFDFVAARREFFEELKEAMVED